MTTYARKIAEAVRDAAANVCDRQSRLSWNDDRRAQARLDRQEVLALDLDAIIAGVPGPELCADEQWQAEEAARKEFPSDMDWTNPANLGATAVERNAFRRGWTAAKHNALTQPQAAEPVDDCSASLPFAILHDEMAALKRFDECVTDGEGYDVPKEMMKRLSEIGLVRRVTANVYEHTNFGLAVLAGDFAPQPQTAARDTKRLDFLCDHIVNVREPLRHGSRDMFWASPTDDDSGHTPSNLRTLIDMEIKRLDRAEDK